MYVCTNFFVWVHVCHYAHRCAHSWRLEANIHIFFFFFFCDRIFHWTWSSLIGYTLLTSKKIQGSFCVCLPSTGLQVHGSVLGLFSDSWTELKTSCCMRKTLQTESSSQSFILLTFRFVWTFEHLFIKFLGFLRL